MTGLVQPLISTVIGSLHRHGRARLSLPPPLPPVGQPQTPRALYVCPIFPDPALEAFAQILLENFQAPRAPQAPFFSPSHDDRATAIIARTQLLVADEQGRVR